MKSNIYFGARNAARILTALSLMVNSTAALAVAVESQTGTASKACVPDLAPLMPYWSLPFDGTVKDTAGLIDPAEESVANIDANESSSGPTAKNSPSAVTLTPNYQVLNLTPPGSVASEKNTKPTMSIEVSVWDGPINVDRIVSSLVDKSFENSPEGQNLDKQLKHLSSVSQKTISVTKDSLNHLVNYEGFDPSERAGKLILDADYKVRNKAWAEYERQKYIDKVHLQVVSSLMQVAEGLGTQGPRATEMIKSGQDSLEPLVGKEEASRTISGMKAWLSRIPTPVHKTPEVPWNTMERNKKLEEALAAAIKQDAVINGVTKQVEHYAHPGKIKTGTARVVETSLTTVALVSPGFAIPIGATVLENAFEQATGGSEQHKLEKELLLDKRIQSRLKVLGQEVAMSIDNYRYALITKNPPLLAFSQEVLGNMTRSSKVDIAKLVTEPVNAKTE